MQGTCTGALISHNLPLPELLKVVFFYFLTLQEKETLSRLLCLLLSVNNTLFSPVKKRKEKNKASALQN